MTRTTATAAHTAAAIDAPSVRTKGSGRGTVTVACKMPNGLQLKVFKFVENRIPIGAGQYAIEQKAQQVGKSVFLNGNAVPYGEAPRHPIVGGYAMTSGIDAEFMEKWLEQYAELPAVKNRLIFIAEDPQYVADEAKEHRALRSGLEPIDVRKGTKDPRMEKGIKAFNKNDDGEED